MASSFSLSILLTLGLIFILLPRSWARESEHGRPWSGPIFGPHRPPFRRPRPPFFVGSFQSDSVTEPQVNTWRVYIASGLPTEFVAELITTNITREGNQSSPASYRIVETAFPSNQTIRDFVFQLGVHNSTLINGNSVDYLVQQIQLRERLSFSYNSTSSGSSRIYYEFQPGGYVANYLIGSVNGTRRFCRI